MHIASIAADLKIHSWPNGELVQSYTCNFQGSMKSLSWGKDGSWLVLVPSKGPAEIISVKENLRQLHAIHEIQQPACAAFQNNTRRNIAVGATTGAVLLYDIKSNNVRRYFPKAAASVFKLEYCTKDSFLLAACENGEILLFNSVTYNLSSSYKVPRSKTVSNIRCHPARRDLIAGASREGVVATWDIHTMKIKFENQDHCAPIMDLTFSPLRSDFLVTVGLDRKLMFFETNSNTYIMQKVLDKSLTAVDFCPDGVGLAVALHDGTIQTYDTRQMNCPLYVFAAHNGHIKQLLFQKTITEEPSEFSSIGDTNTVQHDFNSSNNYNSTGGNVVYGDFLPAIPEAEDVSICGISGEAANSLKQALIERNSNLTSTNQVGRKTSEDEDKKLCKSNSAEFTREASHMLPQKTSSDKSSTAKCTANITPLIDGNQLTAPSSITNLNQMDIEVIRSVIKYEVKQALSENLKSNAVEEELKQEIRALNENLNYVQSNIRNFIRKHFLDLHMFICKEAIKVEDQFNKLREDVVANECRVEDLLMQMHYELEQLQNPKNEK